MLRPTGFQAVLSDVSFRLTDYGFQNFHVKTITAHEQLAEYINPLELPAQFGGPNQFKYEQHLKLSISVDRFTKKTAHVVKKVTK